MEDSLRICRMPSAHCSWSSPSPCCSSCCYSSSPSVVSLTPWWSSPPCPCRSLVASWHCGCPAYGRAIRPVYRPHYRGGRQASAAPRGAYRTGGLIGICSYGGGHIGRGRGAAPAGYGGHRRPHRLHCAHADYHPCLLQNREQLSGVALDACRCPYKGPAERKNYIGL